MPKTIIIGPYASKPPASNPNFQHPKHYNYWPQLIELLKDHHIIQVGVEGEVPLVEDFRKNLSFDKLETLLKESDVWISIDSFLQHFGWSIGKYGVAIFTRSDPLIFGHHENINILKDRKYLRPNQFWLWSQDNYVPEASEDPNKVYETIKSLI